MLSLIEPLYNDKIKPYMPEEFEEELRGYADATKIPYSILEFLNLSYEMSGCSSFAFSNQNGSLIHAHNTDLGKSVMWRQLNQYFLCPLVHYISIPNKHPFIHVSFPLFVGVINGFNERGIAITSHDITGREKILPENYISTPSFLRKILQNGENIEGG